MLKISSFLVVLTAVAVMLAGCASYGVKGTVPQHYENDILTVKMEKEEVGVSVFFITRKADAKQYFGENIVEEGVLALWVNIDNEDEYPVRFESADLKIGEEIIAPLKPYEVYKELKKGGAGAAGRAYLWGIIPAFFFPPAGVAVGAASVLQTNSVNSDIEKDIREKALLPGEIKPWGTVRGFICFRIPEKLRPKEGENILIKGKISVEVIKKGKLLEYNLALP